MGTVRGRLGYAVGPTLLYATGGYAWADLKLTNAFGPFSSSDSQVLNGWTVGAGVEYMIAPKWSLKAEYLYKSFGGETFNTLTFPAASGTLNLHSVQVGVNYHF
jgi:outer membrane immunogenic protein